MSNQLKLFLYILFVVGIFLFVQNKWHIFNISFDNLITDSQTNNSSDAENNSDSSASVNGIIDTNYAEIVVGANKTVRVNIEVADTESERELGLKYRKYLGDYSGMLFIYDSLTTASQDMSDMQIPLDLIFADEQGFIIDIKDSQAPCTSTYCPTITASNKYKYLLEVNSGFCENNGVVIGGNLMLNLSSSN